MKKIDILQIPPSETVAINTIALEKIRAGEKIYNLSAGEPMMPAPEVATRALLQAVQEEKTHYPPVSGLPELRQIAAEWMNGLFGSQFKKETTLVVNGGKFGIFILLQALLKAGDEVLIQSPYWVSYPNMVRLFKGVSTILSSSQQNGWKITPEDIVKNTTDKTKVLILNNAGNPTGALYNKTEIKDILDTAHKLGLFVISDEVYSGLVYDDATFVSCASFAEFRENVAVTQSCSKNFAMTGFRIGFVFASEVVIKTLGDLVSQSTSGVTTMCQYAAIEALKDAQRVTREVNAEMKQRRNIFVNEFNAAFGSSVAMPESGLYLFVPLSVMGWKGGDSAAFCKWAIEKAGVASVPGSAFGSEGYVRFSFGERPDVLKGGIHALAQCIKNM